MNKWYFVREIVPVIVIIVVGCTALVGFVAWMESATCKNQAQMIGAGHEWKLLGGCFVQHKGQWMHYDEYLNRTIAREASDD